MYGIPSAWAAERKAVVGSEGRKKPVC